MSANTADGAICRSNVGWLTFHAHRVAALLTRVDPPFRTRDVRADEQQLVCAMRRKDLLEIAHTAWEDGGSSKVHSYRPAEGLEAWLEDYLPDGPELLPCGHRPFSNPRDEGYGCLEERCDARFDRDTIEAVIDDG